MATKYSSHANKYYIRENSLVPLLPTVLKIIFGDCDINL